MHIKVREMVLEDYDEAHRLWSASEGLSLGDDDSRDGITLYLKRNAGMCFVAVDERKLVGTVLCGHDGRRGILRHLAVAREYRKQGMAKLLVKACLDALFAEGIRKCNVFVMDYNIRGIEFWEYIGAVRLEYDWRTLQLATSGALRTEEGNQRA